MTRWHNKCYEDTVCYYILNWSKFSGCIKMHRHIQVNDALRSKSWIWLTQYTLINNKCCTTSATFHLSLESSSQFQFDTAALQPLYRPFLQAYVSRYYYAFFTPSYNNPYLFNYSSIYIHLSRPAVTSMPQLWEPQPFMVLLHGATAQHTSGVSLDRSSPNKMKWASNCPFKVNLMGWGCDRKLNLVIYQLLGSTNK